MLAEGSWINIWQKSPEAYRMNQSDELGKLPIGKLLIQQAVPASVGFLIMSIYGIVDTIFVGHWVGPMGIAAITVVMPITFLIASIGMSIGIGGASVISRAFGAGNRDKAFLTFGNQAGLTIMLSVLVVTLGSFYQEEILMAFGGRGDILAPAKTYFQINLFGIPFLAWAMMSNNVMRAEGQPRIAMIVLLVPAILNMILDPILIVWLDMGIEGAAWATSISYVGSAAFAVYYFVFGGSELRLNVSNLFPKWDIVKEIFAIGGVSLARQGTISILSIVLNNSLLHYGSELSVSVYGIINRMMMFTNFPVIGITQGFLPIAGYNYGAQKWRRVKDVINLSMRSGTVIAFMIFSMIMIFAPQIVSIFTSEPELIEQTVPALRLAFLATPLLTIQLVGSAYFQAIGKALPALLLTLTKQGFFLIPLILILPVTFGINGIWFSFPIADIMAAGITFFYLRREIRKTLDKDIEADVLFVG